MDWIGFDMSGLPCIGLAWIELVGFNVGFNRSGLDGLCLEIVGPAWVGCGSVELLGAALDKAELDWAQLDWAEWDWLIQLGGNAWTNLE